ncbi:Mycothiol acetyltransferase [Calothrix sp. NIES-4071]|nr:Mycothiol acetyltransferase [Calothrix sp. NIES-4071]BAZ56930.1 Mycothiol acetyltransferase [Calothrix sp. NIES-4105]
MQLICLDNKNEIEAFLRRNSWLYLYHIGDLDDLFWNYTTWYALKDNEQIKQLALLYTQTSVPILLALFDEPDNLMEELLQSLVHLLPRQFYAHLSGNVVNVLAQKYQIQSHGVHYKMALTNTSCLQTVDTYDAVALSESDVNDLDLLYRVSYPGNWFEPHMLKTGYYYGIWRGSDLVSAVGVHVYSQQYQVAALGNFTTHPLFRGQGLGKAVCAKLCQALLQTVDYIGLNVRADNISAINCYTKLGFERIATYEEFSLKLL